MSGGADQFINQLTELGLEPAIEAQLVIYQIEPVEGAHQGAAIATGVEIDELARWPLVPPHWIHLPAGIGFVHTNSQPSSKAGWTKHSRQISRWGQDANPGVGWSGHVRSVLGAATS